MILYFMIKYVAKRFTLVSYELQFFVIFLFNFLFNLFFFSQIIRKLFINTYKSYWASIKNNSLVLISKKNIKNPSTRFFCTQNRFYKPIGDFFCYYYKKFLHNIYHIIGSRLSFLHTNPSKFFTKFPTPIFVDNCNFYNSLLFQYANDRFFKSKYGRNFWIKNYFFKHHLNYYEIGVENFTNLRSYFFKELPLSNVFFIENNPNRDERDHEMNSSVVCDWILNFFEDLNEIEILSFKRFSYENETFFITQFTNFANNTDFITENSPKYVFSQTSNFNILLIKKIFKLNFKRIASNHLPSNSDYKQFIWKKISESFFFVNKTPSAGIRLRTATFFKIWFKNNKKKSYSKNSINTLQLVSGFESNLDYKNMWTCFSPYLHTGEFSFNIFEKFSETILPVFFHINTVYTSMKSNLFSVSKNFLIDDKNTNLSNLNKENETSSNFEHICIESQEGTFFISPLESFLITYSFTNYTENGYFDQIELKRKLYSFTNDNEIRQFVITRYASETWAKVFFDLIESDRGDFEFSQLPYIPNSTLFSNLWAFKLTSFGYYKKINLKYDNDDIKIKKIRFKPGYQTIWREARKILKNIYGLSFKYQYRLTKYLIKFYYLIRTPLHFSTEIQLNQILTNSRFFITLDFSNNFIKHGNVFVNGFICNNIFFLVYQCDFIQLLVNIKYYIIFRLLLNYSVFQKIRLEYKIKKKYSLNEDSSETRTNKTISFRLPLWIRFHKYWITDIPNYLEVDFFTLSIFVIYNPFEDLMWENFEIFNIRYGIINMYNWKYIT